MPDTLIWVGGANNAWEEKSYCDKNCLPEKQTHVIISDVINPVSISGIHEIKSLYLAIENMLTIENGGH